MTEKTKIVVKDETDLPPQETPLVETEEESKTNETEASPDPVKDLEEKLVAAQDEARDNHDRMLRVAAEFENFRKRTAREIEDLKKYATENLIRQLLTVVDNLERAITSASCDSDNGQSVVDGVSLTLTEIVKILETHYVSPIDSLGKPFDPTFHQAMTQEESADQPPNMVVQEFQKGYMIHDRLLRPAMVVVSKAVLNGDEPKKTVDTEA